MKAHLPFLVRCILLLVLVQCAGQIPPPGGPVDTEPPTVLRTVPDTNAVHVTENRVLLEFSEYVERRSVEESIFVSPPVGTVEFDWSGREVELQFEDTLKSNTTYVVTIGTDVVDQRGGNRMAEGFSLAFSTGDSIDQGVLAGRVFDEEPEGVLIFAYRTNGINPDTLDPSKTKPDYLMQTGKNGKFSLSNLAWGNYRVIAVRDEYHNLVYDKQIDDYGVPVSDFVLSGDDPRVDGIYFRLAVEDTTAPFLSGAQPINRDHVRFRFSESVDSISFVNARISIVDTMTGDLQGIRVRYLDPESRSSAGVILSSPLSENLAYMLEVFGVVDSFGNPIDSTGASLLFPGTSVEDTVPPVLRFLSFSDTTIGYPLESGFEFALNEPFDPEPIKNAIHLLDTSGTILMTTFSKESPVRFLVRPEKPLLPASRYRIEIVTDSVKDLSGNAYRDSTLTISFKSFDPDLTGQIEGLVTGQGEEGAVYVSAARLSGRVTREVPADTTGKFEVRFVPEGKYVFAAFQDSDDSKSYSYGLPYPFRPSESFTVGSDTVRVRARWGVEGIVIRFP